MSSDDPSSTVPTSTASREVKEHLIRCLLRSIEKLEEDVLEFPVKLQGEHKATINTTDHYEFHKLPESDLDKLIYESDFRNPTAKEAFAPKRIKSTGLCEWSAPTENACFLLTDTVKALRLEYCRKGDIECAGWSISLESSPYEARVLLRALDLGEGHPGFSVVSYLTSSSGRYGCVLTTHTGKWVKDEKETLDEKHILRSELYTLMSLLQFAVFDMRRPHPPNLAQACFLLSFTATKVRALEARIEPTGEFVFSVRTVLDHVPTKSERMDKFKEVLAWTMYTDGDRADSHVLKWFKARTVPGLLNGLKKAVALDDDDPEVIDKASNNEAIAAADNPSLYAANNDDDGPKVIDKASNNEAIAAADNPSLYAANNNDDGPKVINKAGMLLKITQWLSTKLTKNRRNRSYNN